MTTTRHHIDITVVVCTHNRAAMLRDALASVLRLATDGRFTYEVLVVDNASRDNTRDVVEQLTTNSAVPLRYVFETQPGIVPARNCGLREAHGAWIAFFDDDQLADPRWLLALWNLAVEKGAGCVGGAVTLHLPVDCRRALQPTVRMLLGESDWSVTPQPYDDKRCPGTGNMMVARAWIDRVGAFDHAVGSRGEDTDLFLRLHAAGCPAWYAPEAVVEHVMTTERLQPDYAFRLADWMGANVAKKEHRVHRRSRFLLRWLAKGLRGALLQRLQLILAHARRDAERVLDVQCQLRISAAYGRQGWQLLFPPPPLREPTAAPNNASAPSL
jgi:glycosyltransferase involved in cell wall biosynthesis